MHYCQQLLHSLLALALIQVTTAKISCKDGNGKEVDWFIALKQPESLKYNYITSSSYYNWLKDGSLNNSGPVDATLMQTFTHHSQLLLAYNDEKPKLNTNSLSYAHMKGVVMLNGNNGFWLIHSVPKYPFYPANQPLYPHTGIEYGQSFFCISVNISQVDSIGQQLLVTRPPIYYSNVSEELLDKFPVWRKLLNKKLANRSWRQAEIQSAAGVKMQHFAKSPLWHEDIYDSIVAQQLRSDIMVETFEHGRELLHSNCSTKYSVIRIRSISSNLFNEKFSAGKDHSKWCVTFNSNANMVCIGDMNRALTQFKRGGGLMCFRNSNAHQLFHEAVEQFDGCRSDNQPMDYNMLPLLVLWLMLILLLIGITTAASVSLIMFGFCRFFNRNSYQQI